MCKKLRIHIRKDAIYGGNSVSNIIHERKVNKMFFSWKKVLLCLLKNENLVVSLYFNRRYQLLYEKYDRKPRYVETKEKCK